MNCDVKRVSGRGGVSLRCVHTPIRELRPTLVIALPFGVPAVVADPAIQRLADRFNVITWESRYVLDEGQSFSGTEPMGPDDHADDLIRVLDALRVSESHLVGYCSGAGIALVAAATHSRRFVSLTLVNGEYQLFRRGSFCTAYQKSIDVFMPAVARCRNSARDLFSRMKVLVQSRTPESEDAVTKLVTVPFTREEYLFRYARNYMAYRDFDAREYAAEIHRPVFVIAGLKDQHASAQNSMALAQCLPDAQLSLDQSADHYAFCRPESQTLATLDEHLARIVHAPGKRAPTQGWATHDGPI